MGQAMAGHKVGFDWREVWAVEGRRAVLWLPVGLGIGIYAYFAAGVEPDPATAWVAVPFALLLASGLARRAGLGVLLLVWALAAVGTGYGLALASAHRATAPVLAGPIEAEVSGRVREVGVSASGLPRVVLDRIKIDGLAPEQTPARLRISLAADMRGAVPAPGSRIQVFARLSPPGGPMEPGAFDFALRAWFERIGGLGFARGQVAVIPEAPPDGWLDAARLAMEASRLQVAAALHAAMPGRAGAMAAAMVVNDRSQISPEDNEALRISSLAHLLSISGLHMVMLTGIVFGAVRGGAALVSALALRLPTKKIAAVVALAAAAAYALLSGMEVATERAFVMIAVALVAILADRPAISLRALALAAAIVLMTRPVSLLDAGFQMSFAATAALVAGYEEVARRARGREARVEAPSRLIALARWLGVYVGGSVLTSLLAGAATAPFAAFHFNRSTPYGLIANLAAIPLTGVLVTPAAVAAALLAPLGAAAPALWLMAAGLEGVLQVAHGVAALPGADAPVVAAPGFVLGVMVGGGLWLILLRGPWRRAGAVVVVLGLGAWQLTGDRPALLVAPGGGLIGLMGAEGRSLSAARGEGFAADTWLRRDGDRADQDVAADRPGFQRKRGYLAGDLGQGWQVVWVRARDPDPDLLTRACAPQVVLIAPAGGALQGPCRYFGRDALAASGALAIDSDGTALRVRAAGEGARRLWSR